MNVAPGAPGSVCADARVEHRLHKRPVVMEEDALAEILFPPATAVITSHRGTRGHPDQDNGRSRENRELAELPGSLYPDRSLRRQLRWGGVRVTRIVAHLLASTRQTGRATLQHLCRATNDEFAGQCPENRCLPERQQRRNGTDSWRMWSRRAMNWKLWRSSSQRRDTVLYVRRYKFS